MSEHENEFRFIVKFDEIGAGAVHHNISADSRERAALCSRFDLQALDLLEADLALVRQGLDIIVTGRMRANVTQFCIASGDPVIATINEPVTVRFITEMSMQAEQEIELAEDDCDTLLYDGKAIDIGEAVAQSLGLTLDPYPRSKNAAEILRQAGVKSEEEALAETGPFAALAKLQGKLP